MNSPEEIVLSCAKYLRANERRLCTDVKALEEEADSSLTSSFTSALTLGYIRPENTQKEQIFTIDPVKLSIIIAKFEEYGLLVDGVPQLAPVPPAHSIRTVSSLASLASLASSLSTLTFLGWRKNENTGLDAKLHFQNELEYVYHFFQKIQRLRIGFLNVHPNTQYDTIPLPVSLGIFRNLTHLDLRKLPPRYFTHWDVLHQNLESFVCRGGIVDLHDLFIDTIENDISIEVEATWPKLSSIDLSYNDLASLAVDPILRVTSCESLNLSYNLLLSVPPVLTELFRLRDLDLSHNMISNLTGIDRILGNITVLDLSYNRLKNLVGLHKLWALVVINIGGNEISEIDEVGRLAALPSLHEVYIEGNPLTRKPGYRAQLFSIFCAHDLDITLDGTGPSFLERRNIVTESKAVAGIDSVADLHIHDKCTPGFNSVSEKSVSDDIPTLKTRHSRRSAIGNKRKGKRIVDIDANEASTESILESPRSSKVLMSEEPNESENEDLLYKLTPRFSTNSDPMSRRTDRASFPKSKSPTRYKKLFVHRLAELENNIQTGCVDPHFPTRGRRVCRSSQSSSPRSRSPASIRSSMSAMTATNSNEDFRKKIEALRNEAGSTWLKIYSEIQHPQKPHKKEKVVDNQDSKDDNFIAGSLPSMLTLVSLHKPSSSIDEPDNSNDEILENNSHIMSSIKAKSSKPVEISTPVQSKLLPEFSKPESVILEPEIEIKELPEGVQYKIQVTEYSSRTRSKRFVRVPTGDRILVTTSNAFVEADPNTMDIICQRGFQGLLRVETKRVGKLMEHAIFRLEFKYRRYDNPTFCDYYVLHESEDTCIEKELQSKLENIVKNNWKEGKGHEVYKQGKCLNCSWVGFLNLEDIRDKGTWHGIKKLNIGLSPVTSESESDAKEKERKCPVCSGTFLVEFFGREENETIHSNEVPNWAFTSSSNITNTELLTNTKPGFFDSWLINPLGGIGNRSDAKLSDKSQETLTQSQGAGPEVNEIEDLKKMEKVAGYSASLPPYRSLTNAIRLYFQLTIIEDDTEKIISWIPSSYIPHAPTSVALPSMWSMMTSSVENVPKNTPTEKPIYMGLTNKSIYLLVPQSTPLSGSTPSIENNPAKHLKLLYTIPILLIARVDVGPNRQTLTLHMNLVSNNGSNTVPTNSPLALPPHSITFLIRDQLKCSDFLNTLVEMCYDHDFHVEDGKVKMINHDIEWAVKNMRQQVLISEVDSAMTIPNYHLTGADPASGQEVVVDKVNFDFFKFYYLIARLIESYSPPATVTDSPNHSIEAFTMIGTEKYLYLCKERHDVWPPAVANIDDAQNSTTIRKAEGIWGRRKNHPLVCTLVEQYKRVEVVPISWITKIEEVKKGMNMSIGKEKDGANGGCTATGWEVLVKITFHKETIRSNNSIESVDIRTEETDGPTTQDNANENQEQSVAEAEEKSATGIIGTEVHSETESERNTEPNKNASYSKSHHGTESEAHFSWCIMFSSEASADEFIKSLPIT